MFIKKAFEEWQYGSVVKDLPANAGDIRNMGSIPGSGKFSGIGNGTPPPPLQYSCLENPMDRGTWWATVQSGAQSLKSCPTLCDPMDCSPPGSSLPGVFQARILEWVTTSFSRGSSQPRYQTHISYISCIGRQVSFFFKQLVPPGLQSMGCKESDMTEHAHMHTSAKKQLKQQLNAPCYETGQ